MKKKRKKLKKFVHISSILGETLSGLRYKPAVELENIWEVWNGAVGNIIAENAQPSSLKEKILVVNVSNSVWNQELRFQKDNIMTKLNDTLGKVLVERIEFKVGPL
ncbi:MAG: DUF721 domain-containing protein [Desulfobacterales bacterium]|nr:DUF721 domain-containing protein [Desulfobacterales bacterium]